MNDNPATGKNQFERFIDGVLAALRSPGAMMIALILALFAQGEHTAQVFAHFSHGGAGNAQALSYAFAAAVEVAVLLFVLKGHKRISYAFAGATFLTNIVYYAIGGIDLLTAAVAPVLLLSALLPAVIVGYSHTIAEGPKTDLAETVQNDAEKAAGDFKAIGHREGGSASQQALTAGTPPPTHAAGAPQSAPDDDIEQPSLRDRVLQLRAEKLTIRQIAEELGVKEGTVSSWLYRERKERAA